MNMRKLKQWLAALVFSAMAGLSGLSHAGQLSLSNVPLFLVTSVEPNVFFLLDDSGSMEWEVLVESGGQGLDPSLVNYGLYLFPTVANGFDQGWGYFPYTVVHEESVSNRGVWRLQTPEHNLLYYDYRRTYEPWGGNDAAGNPLFGDASTASSPHLAAVSPGSSTRFNLGSTISYLTWRFDISNFHSDSTYPATYYKWTDSNLNGVVDSTDAKTRVRITSSTSSYTTSSNRTDCAAAPTCTYTEEMRNFANWFTYYRKRSYVARAAIGEVLNQTTGMRVGYYTYNNGLRQSAVSLSTTAGKASLLSSLYATSFPCSLSGCPGTPGRQAFIDLGDYFKGVNSPIQTAGNGGTCQQNFNIVISDGFWNGRLTTASTGTELDSDPTIGNADADGNTDFDGASYAGASFTTMADAAMYYYEHDLKPSLANEVPIIEGLDEAAHQHLVTYTVSFGLNGTLDPFDTATPGVASDTDPEDPSFSWPAIAAADRDTAKTVDDLWHAAYNGRGEYLSANDPDSLVTSLSDILAEVADRTASAASVAASAGFLDTDTKLYQARFSSSDWDGQLVSYDLNNDGSLASVLWDAGCIISGGTCEENGVTYPGQNWDSGREIITVKPSGGSRGSGIPFRWPSNPASPTASELDASQVAALKLNPETGATDSDTVGFNRLKYLRGFDVAGMRNRSSVLGDIVHSDPVFVGEPAESYPDNLHTGISYSDFVRTYANRTEMIYMGANDGMLHGIDASTAGGEEKIAYVPGPVYRNLSRLTSTGYGSAIAHRYFVDAPPAARDAVVGGQWATVLSGGLRGGGQGYFALDVTNPARFDESNASSLFLWEFDDSHDADLGYSYGRPEIVKLNADFDFDGEGDWAVVFSSGYNNTDTDGGADVNVSSTGNAVIWVVNINTGAVLKKFDTGVGTVDDPTGASRPNGMGAVTAFDTDGDFQADYLYAGDLFGNLWKVDISDTNPANWDFAFTSGATKLPLFVAEDSSGTVQPITVQPRVTKHPAYAGNLVLFASGKYIESTDHSSTGQQTQTVYGIWDREGVSTSTFTRSHLLQQEIIEEAPFSAAVSVRLTTDHALTWFVANSGNPPNGSSAYLGWYMDMYNTENNNTDNFGERIASQPVLVRGLYIIVSFIPSSDPCSFGGDSWLMVIDPFTGQRSVFPVFDINGDDIFDENDNLADGVGGSNVVSAIQVKGILVTPTIVRSTTRSIIHSYLTTSEGADPGMQKVQHAKEAKFRQSWRQLWGED